MNFERIALAAGGLIVLYMVLSAPRTGSVVQAIAGSTGGLIGVLQGRSVQFPGGGGVSGGIA